MFVVVLTCNIFLQCQQTIFQQLKMTSKHCCWEKLFDEISINTLLAQKGTLGKNIL